MPSADTTVLGYLLMHPDGYHYHDGQTWRRLYGTVDGAAVCKQLPKVGWHPDRKAALDASRQLDKRTGELAIPTRVRFLCRS